jgi:thioredoxin
MAWLTMLAAGLPSCEKVRQVVREAAAKGDASATSKASKAPARPGPGAVFEGLEKLRGAREDYVQAAAGGSPEVREIGAGEFDGFVARSDRLVVIDFHADWCGPCRTLGPVLDQVVGELGGRVSLGKVNVDQHRDLAAKCGVRGIPDVRVYRGGRQVDGFVGLLGTNELRARLKRELDLLPPPPGEPAGTSQTAGGGPKEPAIQRMKKDWLPPGIERR